MVYRLYVEKKPGFDHEAQGLFGELKSFLGIQGLTGLRVLNRYDAFSPSLSWTTSLKSCPKARTSFSLPSICPASSTSALTLPHSASS